MCKSEVNHFEYIPVDILQLLHIFNGCLLASQFTTHPVEYPPQSVLLSSGVGGSADFSPCLHSRTYCFRLAGCRPTGVADPGDVTITFASLDTENPVLRCGHRMRQEVWTRKDACSLFCGDIMPWGGSVLIDISLLRGTLKRNRLRAHGKSVGC